MIRSDNHVHTYFSTDSSEPMKNMVQKAKELGLSSLCFTDHMDYDFPSESGETEFYLDIPKYHDEILKLQQMTQDIQIRYGIELGLKDNVIDDCKELIEKEPFDFVICSTHLVDNIDPYNDAFWQNTDEKHALTRYYESTLFNIRQNVNFDVYGHIDYITRYTPRMKALRQKGIVDEQYINELLNGSFDIIDEILKNIIAIGKGIEINTSGFKYGLGHPNPHEKILKRYRELGGEIISVGSDGHETAHLAYDFAKVPDLLKYCGFKYYTEFKDRKPQMILL